MIALIVAGTIGLASGVAAYLWARRQLQRADALHAQGWACIGWNFFTGPVMAPKWIMSPTLVLRLGETPCAGVCTCELTRDLRASRTPTNANFRRFD